MMGRILNRDRPRFFDRVGHQTTNAFIGNKHFFTKKRPRQAYPNYEQSCERSQNSKSFFSVLNWSNLSKKHFR
jgi:hypothetical protein